MMDNTTSTVRGGVSGWAQAEVTPIVTIGMLTCQLCSQRFSMSGKLSDYRTPVLAVNPSQGIEGPYCIGCAGQRDGLRSFQIDEARVALCKLMHQQIQMEAAYNAALQQQHHHHRIASDHHGVVPGSAPPSPMTHQHQGHRGGGGGSSVGSGCGNMVQVALPTPAAAAQPEPPAPQVVVRADKVGNKPQDAPGKTATGVGSPPSVMDHHGMYQNRVGLLHHQQQQQQQGTTSDKRGWEGGAHSGVPSHLQNNGMFNSSGSKRQRLPLPNSTAATTATRDGRANNLVKSNWSAEEDALVTEAVQTSVEQPFTKWSELANSLPGRIGKQIRDRWLNHLDPRIDRTPFSRDEDVTLYKAYKKHGKRWVEISTRYYDSKRSENHIKNRFYSAAFKKFVKNEMEDDIFETERLRNAAAKNNDKKASAAAVVAAAAAESIHSVASCSPTSETILQDDDHEEKKEEVA